MVMLELQTLVAAVVEAQLDSAVTQMALVVLELLSFATQILLQI
jgi:hypothetical protein